MVAFELTGVGVAPRHQRGRLGDASVRLLQLHAVFASEPVALFDRYMQLLGTWGDVMALGCIVVSPYALEVARS
jgi:hypothetical protein